MTHYAKGAAALLCCVLIFSCAKNAQNKRDSSGVTDSQGKKIEVSASFYTMADFAQKIGGELISVRTLIPSGQDAHDWEPSPRDSAVLENAAVLIYNGAGFEPWAKDILASLSNKQLTAIEAGANFNLIEGDPHIWLSPLGAKHALKNIAEGLAAADPQNAAFYRLSYEKYAARCDSLDSEFRTALCESDLKTEFISVHAAFGYLAREYELTQLSAGGGEPSPLAMRRIVERAKETGSDVVFYEDAESKKTAEAIAREINGSAVFLHPLEGLSSDEVKAGEDYFSIMQKNLAALSNSLAR
jgi:zinc transport system substrate-binding protein